MTKLSNKQNLYTVNSDFILQESSNKILIFDADSSYLYTLNETASFIFTLLKKQLSFDRIVRSVTEEYSVEKEQAEKDIRQIIDNLLHKKIIAKEK